jgi:hypothetical protein
MPNSAAIDPSQVQWDSPPADTAPAAGGIDPSQVQWDPPAPKQTAAGAGQAVASGLNAGSADLLGLPVDTARNVLELGKAGLGFAWHETTGRDIPDALQPLQDRSSDVGSSDWIKAKLRHIEGANAVDVAQDTPTNRVLHGAGEAVPSAFVGGEASSVPTAVRAAVGGATAGAAQQGAAEAGAGTVGQAIAGLAGGAAGARIGAPRAAAPKVEPTPQPQPQTVKPTVFEPAPTAPGEPPRLNIGGTSTAHDALKQGTPLPAIEAPAADPSAVPIASEAEQAARAQTLRDIGLQEARESAITGNHKETGTDFQTGKLDGAAGNRMTGVINKERAALQGYAGQLADATGGTRGMDQTDLYNRGSVITKPVEQLADHFDAATKELYAEADRRAAGQPVGLAGTDAFLKNERASFLGTVEGKQLREGVQARMRDLGLMDGDGNVQQATVQQAERMKQYLNDQWSPRTSRLIGQLKSAIDDDVMQAAGQDLYAKARQNRALRSTLLDDPTGIAKLASPDDRLGINRAVPLEQVPDYVTKLPVDQFGHIVNVLRDVPKEVQPAASAALNEIRAHFANSVEKAGNSTQGMWNTKAANEFLNKNQLRMAHVFSPEEMARFKTLADAGHILRMDRTYPGAAAQGHNLAMRGVLGAGKLVHNAGGVAGFMHGGVEGAAAGHVIGGLAEKGVAKLSDRVLRAQVEKRIRKL